MRIYVAGPYTAKRETCEGCRHRSVPLNSGRRWCNLLADYIIDDLPCDRCVDDERQDANVAAADATGRELLAMGHTPFVPHTMTRGWEKDDRFQHDPDHIGLSDFLRMDFEWLRFCDALLFLGPSPGASAEREFAKGMGLTIYYSIDEIPDLREPPDASD